MHVVCAPGAEPFFWDQIRCRTRWSLTARDFLSVPELEFVDVFSVG